uniref:SH3 domain-binding protein 5 n=1 Tax=Pavo cristatus TaxID=9049 RepID=A0A8C9FS70_PAVCR
MEPGSRRGRVAEEAPRPEEEEVDPRIQGELEKLNQSTDVINRRETELEVGNSSLCFPSVCVGFCKQQKEVFEQVPS